MSKTVSSTFTHDSSPNARVLLPSLRNIGYDSYQAVADIIDNSIDAMANNIYLYVYGDSEKNISNIVIADDGNGMTRDELDQAIRLGSDADRGIQSLGKYGMGLCTASLSLCRKLSVYTKAEGEPALLAINDLDHMIDSNSFSSALRQATDEDLKPIAHMIPDSESWTIVIWDKIDRITNSRVDSFKSTLKTKVAQIFRSFIKSYNKNIYINEGQKHEPTKIDYIDPLNPFDDESMINVWAEETIEISDKENGVTGKVKYRIVLLPREWSYQERIVRGHNVQVRGTKQQGFYILRNDREIAEKDLLSGIYSRDNSFARFRAEIVFTSDLDDMFGVDVSKSKLSLSQSLIDQLRDKGLHSNIKSACRDLKSQENLNTATDDETVKSIEGAKENINTKASRGLLTGVKVKEKRNPKQNHGESHTATGDSDIERTPRKTQSQKKLRECCEIEVVSMRSSGPIYEVCRRGGKVVVSINCDHPFYENIVEKSPSRHIVYQLIWAFGAAQLDAADDSDELEIAMMNFMETVSKNVRALYS